MRKLIIMSILLVFLSITYACRYSNKIDIDGNLYEVNFNRYENKKIEQLYYDLIQKPDTIVEYKDDGVINSVVITYYNQLEIYLEVENPNLTTEEKETIVKSLRVSKYINSKIGKQLIIYYKFD